MVELQDRINKPRSLRGTPSYAFVNKVSLAVVGCSIVIGTLMGIRYFYVQKRDNPRFGKETFRTIHEELQEERVRIYTRDRRRTLEEAQARIDDESFRSK